MAEQSNFQDTPQAKSPFDVIRNVDEQGSEYWRARDLAKILAYDDYRNFLRVINKAQKACEQSGHAVSDHFVDINEMIQAGKGARRRISNMRLSRFACYLIVQNGDPDKPIVALGQIYFAVQTRRQELAEQFAGLPEEQKRLLLRSEMAIDNQKLNAATRLAGVISPSDFAIFTDHGYRGLYGGLTENAIHARKGLGKKERILDYMGSEELADNIFRVSQTDAAMKRENVQGKANANATHFTVGRKVREFIINELGGTPPEDLPTPEKSIQQLQRDERSRLAPKEPLNLFNFPDEEV